MNYMKLYQNTEFGQVKTLEIDGEIWFVAKEISMILGYRETANMRKLLDTDEYREVNPQKIGISGFVQNGNIKRMLLINESGLYTAILNSRLPDAKRFKRWVTSEVLPSIRRMGVYCMDDVLNSDNAIDYLIERLRNGK